MEKTVKPLFFDKIYDKNYKFDSNSIKIDNGLLCLMMKRLQVFNIAKNLFLPDWPSIMKPANPMKLVIGKYKDHPCIISLKKINQCRKLNTYLKAFFANRNYRRNWKIKHLKKPLKVEIYCLRILTGKKHPKIKLKRLRKIRIWTWFVGTWN